MARDARQYLCLFAKLILKPLALLPYEIQQVNCQTLLFGGEQTMRCAFVFDQIGLCDTFCGCAPGSIDRYDLVTRAVNNECGHLEGGQITAEIGR